MDCAFSADGRQICVGAVLFDGRTKEEVGRVSAVRPCKFPYVPGLLSFREAPALLEVLAQLDPVPDVVFCDGQGRAHPRRLGLACHVGLLSGLPTVGVAKSLLCGGYREPGRTRGNSTRLTHRGETVGRVVRTRTGVRPVFVSVGHLATLHDAVRLTLRYTNGFRLPEPTRIADRYVAAVKRATGCRSGT
jgi:deoxyribonuclease V